VLEVEGVEVGQEEWHEVPTLLKTSLVWNVHDLLTTGSSPSAADLAASARYPLSAGAPGRAAVASRSLGAAGPSGAASWRAASPLRKSGRRHYLVIHLRENRVQPVDELILLAFSSSSASTRSG
jgi:hypothetical protein